MRKQNIINLIRFYVDRNDSGFRSEAYEVAKHFDKLGEYQLSEYIMALLSSASTFIPQSNTFELKFLERFKTDNANPLPLPKELVNDIIGVINAVTRGKGVNKFLFEGAPGTGKTETVKNIARMLERDLFVVSFESIIDSKLGQTAKNIADLFLEISSLPNPNKALILFDEIDALAIDRINSNDVREMGRATSAILKGLDRLSEDVVLIATTNLFRSFDKALARRFDATINFDRYSQADLLDVSVAITNTFLTRYKSASKNTKLLKKILSSGGPLPYPGELKNLIKTSIAFSDPNNEYDYMKRLYVSVGGMNVNDIRTLREAGFTVREIEMLTGVPKSSAARTLNTEVSDE